MLLEAVIATSCLIQNSSCSTATSAYYESNRELQEAVKNLEQIGQRIINKNEYIVYVATPTYAIISGQPAAFKIHKGLMLNVNIKQENVALQWTW